VTITTMRTLITYRFVIDTDLPKVSYLTRVDYYILLSTIVVYASLIEVVITSMLAKRNQLSQARAIDRWMHLLFPLTLSIVAFVSLML
jgi:gamma-aminobutyric acid receptor subunit beta